MSKGYLLFDLSDPIAKKIYRLTLKFPHMFQFSIGDQLRRSSLSVVLNIVEAGARISLKENRHLLSIAFGSLKETKYLLNFAKEFNLITENQLSECLNEVNQLAKVLYGLLYKKR